MCDFPESFNDGDTTPQEASLLLGLQSILQQVHELEKLRLITTSNADLLRARIRRNYQRSRHLLGIGSDDHV